MVVASGNDMWVEPKATGVMSVWLGTHGPGRAAGDITTQRTQWDHTPGRPLHRPNPARAANTERMPRVPFRVQSVFFPVTLACTDPPNLWEEPEGRKGVDNPGSLGLVGGHMSSLGTLLLVLGAVSHSLGQEIETVQAGQGPKPAVLRLSLLEARVSAESSCSSKWAPLPRSCMWLSDWHWERHLETWYGHRIYQQHPPSLRITLVS